MAERTYHEQSVIKYTKQLREIQDQLPSFTRQFFIAIDQTTAARTRVAYATDLKNFFEYVQLNYKQYADTDITDYSISILTELKSEDFEQYIQYLKLYSDKNGKDVVNHERSIKRKLSALRCMYQYFHKNKIINENPILQVNMPKLHDKAIIRFDEDETANFLDEVETGTQLTKKQKEFHEKNGTRDLAILTLIVTPLVMNIIRKARISADKRSVDAYGRSIELAIAGYLCLIEISLP